MKMAAALLSLFTFSKAFQRIFTFLLCLLVLARVNAQNRSPEVDVLLRFKTMVDVDSSATARAYWSTWEEQENTPCCWYGITCTPQSTVARLDFSGWYLTQLPSVGVLSNLPDLCDFDFSRNNLIDRTGAKITIPDDIGSLVGLIRLDLSNNHFSGPIPPSISACRNLRYLSIQSTNITGEIPNLSGLKNLQHLYVSHNKLSGPLPKWLGELSSLMEIDMSNNTFFGTIPSLSNLTSLLLLWLDNNTFTGFEEPMFPNAKNLAHLSISGNQLQGSIPDDITKLPNLRVLDLSRNQLSGQIPRNFSLNMSEAIWMDLRSNQLTGTIPANLLQPTSPAINLPGLKFSHNRLTGPIPFDRTQQYNYYELDFSHNNLSGPIPSICNNGNSNINYLYLDNNHLNGDIVDFLGECYAHIQVMQLANNSFTGDLSRVADMDTGLDFLSRESIPQLMDLSYNDLHVSTTAVNADPLRVLLEFFVLNTSLVEFRMKGNNLSRAPLPAYFNSSANKLEVLDLSSTSLIGEISDAAFNKTWLPKLQSLYLSNNHATGQIPEATVMLPNLLILDVANNSLSGCLPKMPDRLYNPSFFAGNGGLCGGPLHPCPRGVQWWVLLMVVGGPVIIIVISGLVVTWRWRVYNKMHQQDADLIKMLLARESAALMSLRELRKATSNFAKSAVIGEGGFGTVYTGKLSDGTIVAIKRSKHEGSHQDKDQFLNEVRILSQVNHRHLVKLLGCCMENKAALLVFEFVSNGTLEGHLQGNIGAVCLSWKQRLRIAVQTADALNYLHSAITFPIYHRDVKSNNILLDDDLNAKVADFGISRLVPLEATHVSTIAIQGTIGYIDPEYYTTYQLTGKSDVYSFGVVLLELISAKPAVDFQRGGEQTGLVNFAKKHVESGDLQEVIDVTLMETYNDVASNGKESILNVGRLAMKCTHMHSKARPSMHEVLKELQNMWFEFQGPSKDFHSSTNDDVRNPQHDQTYLLSNSLSSSSSSLHHDVVCSQMSQISHLSRMRSISNKW